MHLGCHLVEPAADVLAVGDGSGGSLGRVGRVPGLHRGGELRRDLVALAPDLQPLLLAVRRGAPVCLAVAVGVAPALLRLLDVLGRVVLAEHLEHLGGGQVDAHLVCLQGLRHGRGHGLQPLDPGQQLAVLGPQLVAGGRARAVGGDQRRHLLEVEAELPPGQHPLQPGHVDRRVGAVAVGRPPARRQQPDLVVVVQGAHGDSRQPCDLPHGVGLLVHARDARTSRHVQGQPLKVRRRRRGGG